MLRSYAAAHGLARPQHAVLEVSADSITFRVGSQMLLSTPTAVTFPDGSTQAFALNEDGSVTLDGVTEEMDLAAEKLARMMLHG